MDSLGRRIGERVQGEHPSERRARKREEARQEVERMAASGELVVRRLDAAELVEYERRGPGR